MVEVAHPSISVSRQCELLGLSRSSFYYRSQGVGERDLWLMRFLDEQYTRTPFYGSRRMTAWLRSMGYEINRKKVVRLMREMGLETIYPKPRLSVGDKEHKVYPYLLRGLIIGRADQVWCADITYIRLRKGFIYLVAIMDWFSRYVLAWEISNSMEAEFCVWALERALKCGKPDIFNTDQGVQFSSERFVQVLEFNEILVSMDGRGRVLDNIFIERLWRAVKYEEVYLHEYESVREAVEGLRRYFEFYNHQRFHQALEYKTPAEVYGESLNSCNLSEMAG
jgi:putative transposase